MNWPYLHSVDSDSCKFWLAHFWKVEKVKNNYVGKKTALKPSIMACILIVKASIFCLNEQIFSNVLFMGNIQNQIGVCRFEAANAFIILIETASNAWKTGCRLK